MDELKKRYQRNKRIYQEAKKGLGEQADLEACAYSPTTPEEEREEEGTADTQEVCKGADSEWRRPGSYSQNYALIEDAEERREMGLEDLRDYTEEEWQQLAPWRKDRIQELRRKKGKGKGAMPKYPEEPKGPFEPDGGPSPGGPSSGSGSGERIALRAL